MGTSPAGEGCCEWISSDGIACPAPSAVTWPSIIAETIRTGRYCREHAILMAERALAGLKHAAGQVR